MSSYHRSSALAPLSTEKILFIHLFENIRDKTGWPTCGFLCIYKKVLIKMKIYLQLYICILLKLNCLTSYEIGLDNCVTSCTDINLVHCLQTIGGIMESALTYRKAELNMRFQMTVFCLYQLPSYICIYTYVCLYVCMGLCVYIVQKLGIKLFSIIMDMNELFEFTILSSDYMSHFEAPDTLLQGSQSLLINWGFSGLDGVNFIRIISSYLTFYSKSFKSCKMLSR